MRIDRNSIAVVLVGVVLLALGPVLPSWAVSLLNVALCYGTVVLGMMLLMRTGIVSFGHGLYYCLGAYAAATSRGPRSGCPASRASPAIRRPNSSAA